MDIQGTSLHYFIYMCIVQASSVSATTGIDHHVSWFHFWAKWIIMQHLLAYFSNEKNKPIKRTNLFHLSKISVRKLLNMPSVFRINESSFFWLWFFCQKNYSKKFYITLTNTFGNKDFWKNRIAFEVLLKVNLWTRKFPWMKRSQIFFL